MKKEIALTIYLGLLLTVAFVFGAHLRGQMDEHRFTFSAKTGIPCETDACKHDLNFTKQSNGYSGWQMGCLYAKGSNADWDEKTRKYGDQKYLDCANGMVYEVIGSSPSSDYFDPDDTATNEKWCSKGKVATFNFDNPMTPENENGTFNSCFTW